MMQDVFYVSDVLRLSARVQLPTTGEVTWISAARHEDRMSRTPSPWGLGKITRLLADLGFSTGTLHILTATMFTVHSSSDGVIFTRLERALPMPLNYLTLVAFVVSF